MITLRAHTFTYSDPSFRAALDQAGIENRKINTFPPGTVVMSSFNVEIILNEGWGVLAVLCVTWLSARKSRLIKVRLKDGTNIELKGYAAEEAQKILAEAVEIHVIDTKKLSDESE